MEFVKSLFISNLSFFGFLCVCVWGGGGGVAGGWWLGGGGGGGGGCEGFGRAEFRDRGISWLSSPTFLKKKIKTFDIFYVR